MKVTIIGPGKLKEKYLKEGIDEYKKRLTPFTKVEIIEVPDEKCPENLSTLDMEIVKKKEGESILAKISHSSFVIALDINAPQLTSTELAQKIEEINVNGFSHITFIIGGSLGLHDNVKDIARIKLSFSKLTFPHQLMKLILMEQVYRAYKIIKNEPYHK